MFQQASKQASKLIKPLLVVLASTFVVLSANVASASYYSCLTNYRVLANFGGDDNIASISIHAGVVERSTNSDGSNPRITWSDSEIPANTLFMKKVGDHYFAKFELNGLRGGGDGGVNMENLGPVIQYFVNYKNGTQAIFPPNNQAFPIQITNDYGNSTPENYRQEVINAYNSTWDATSTSGIGFHTGSGCMN